MDSESNPSPEVNGNKQEDELIDSSEDEDECIPQGITEDLNVPITSQNTYPSPYPHNEIGDSPIMQPEQIKLENETDVNSPQDRLTSTDLAVQPTVEKRKYTRRELPPPREGQGGVRREAFSKAVQKFQQDLKRKKK